MDVIELTADTAEAFIAKQPVTAILFFTPGDEGVHDLLDEFNSLASTFSEHVGFGSIDLTAAENVVLVEQGIVVATRTVIYYRFGEPAGEHVGRDEILKWLTHGSLVDSYGRTDSWLKLVR